MNRTLLLGSRKKCFVPGASAIYLFNEGSGTTLRDYSGNGNDGTLGATSYSAADPLTGGLAAVLVYPFALTPSQIAQNVAVLRAALAPRGIDIPK